MPPLHHYASPTHHPFGKLDINALCPLVREKVNGDDNDIYTTWLQLSASVCALNFHNSTGIAAV